MTGIDPGTRTAIAARTTATDNETVIVTTKKELPLQDHNRKIAPSGRTDPNRGQPIVTVETRPSVRTDPSRDKLTAIDETRAIANADSNAEDPGRQKRLRLRCNQRMQESKTGPSQN